MSSASQAPLQLIHSLIRYLLCVLSLPKQRCLLTKGPTCTVRRGTNFRFPGLGLPSSIALRQRDAPLQLPGLRAPPAAPRVSERLLLHSPAGGGAAVPALGPPLRGALLRTALAGGAAVVRSP